MSTFQARCHEWGDNSDYLWTTCETLDGALKSIKSFYEKEPHNIYEYLYIIEVAEDGTKSIPNWDRNTYEPL